MARRPWLLLHRYAGLGMAAFLIIVGLSGSVLAFHKELDGWLNPDRDRVAIRPLPVLDAMDLRDRALERVPGGYSRVIDLHVEHNRAYEIALEPDPDPTHGEDRHSGYTALKLDPYTGVELSRSDPSQAELDFWPLTRENILQFILYLHVQLALGHVGGLILGIVALVWCLDCLVSFYLTLPARREVASDALTAGRPEPRSFRARWATAWKIRWRASSFRLNFDLHRAGGLWVWAVLFMFAWSSGTFNLPTVFHPVNDLFFPEPEYHVDALPRPQFKPSVGFREARAIGRQLMAEQGRLHDFEIEAEGYFAYDPQTGLFILSVNADPLFGGQDGTYIRFDAQSKRVLQLYMPSGLHAGATFRNWLSALHMAAFGGQPYKSFVCVMGLVITMLSVTGVYVWYRKRTARRLSLARRIQSSPRPT
jgi:uncharacterized iron-regulated membrane protein